MKKAIIVPFKDAHHWKKDNEYLLTGYRKHHNTIQKILNSLKTKHNELMNVYTHLIPAILLTFYTLFFTINTIIFSKDEISINFKLPLLLGYFFSIICLGSSSIYHLFCCMDCKTCDTLLRYDLGGILSLIYIYCLTSYYYLFYYSTFFVVFYSLIITLGVFFMLFVITSPKYQGDEFRSFRTLSFIALVSTNIFPIVHSLVNNCYSSEENDLIDYSEAFAYIGLELFFYSVGVFFFLGKYPEKAFPKKFDFWMNSHTLWHVCVVLAIYMQIQASNLFYSQRRDQILENLSMS